MEIEEIQFQGSKGRSSETCPESHLLLAIPFPSNYPTTQVAFQLPKPVVRPAPPGPILAVPTA